MPILPMFITALGGGGLVVGLIGGVRDSIASILKVFCGYWSDKKGKRKIFVVSGYFISSIFKLFIAFSRSWHHVLIFTGLERIGKGLRTAPRDAIIAESAPQERGKGFGIHRALDTSGAILGSTIVFLLYWFFFFGLRSIILISAGLAFMSLIPLYFVKERRKKPVKVRLSIGLKSLPRRLKMFILVSTMFSLANFSYMFFILRSQEFFSGKFAIGVPILLYVLFNIFYALFAVPFGVISDRVGRKKVILFGYLLYSFVALGFLTVNAAYLLILLFPLYGLVYAIVDGNQRAYVSDLIEEKYKATALGTFHTATGLATLPASVIAGILWQIDPALTFIYGALLGLISSALFTLIR